MSNKQRNFLGSFGRNKKGEASEVFQVIADDCKSVDSFELEKPLKAPEKSLEDSPQQTKLTFKQRLKKAISPSKKNKPKVEGLPVFDLLDDASPPPPPKSSTTREKDTAARYSTEGTSSELGIDEGGEVLTSRRPGLLAAPSNPDIDVATTAPVLGSGNKQQQDDSSSSPRRKRRPVKRRSSKASEVSDLDADSTDYATEESVVGGGNLDWRDYQGESDDQSLSPPTQKKKSMALSRWNTTTKNDSSSASLKSAEESSVGGQSSRSILGVFVNSDHEDESSSSSILDASSTRTPRKRRDSSRRKSSDVYEISEAPIVTTTSDEDAVVEKSSRGDKRSRRKPSPGKKRRSSFGKDNEEKQDDNNRRSTPSKSRNGRSEHEREQRYATPGRKRLSSSLKSPTKTRRVPARSMSARSFDSDGITADKSELKASVDDAEDGQMEPERAPTAAPEESRKAEMAALLGEIQKVATTTPRRRGRRRIVSSEDKKMIVSALEAGDTDGKKSSSSKSPRLSADRSHTPLKKRPSTPRKKKILVARRVVKRRSGNSTESLDTDEGEAFELSKSDENGEIDLLRVTKGEDSPVSKRRVKRTGSPPRQRISPSPTRGSSSPKLESEDSGRKHHRRSKSLTQNVASAVTGVAETSQHVSPRRRGRRPMTPRKTHADCDSPKNASSLDKLMSVSAGTANRRCQSVVSPYESKKRAESQLSRKLNGSPRFRNDSPSILSDGRMLKSSKDIREVASISPGELQKKRRSSRSSPRSSPGGSSRNRSPEKKRESVTDLCPPLDVSGDHVVDSPRGRARNRVEQLKKEASTERSSRSRTPQGRRRSGKSPGRTRSRSIGPENSEGDSLKSKQPERSAMSPDRKGRAPLTRTRSAAGRDKRAPPGHSLSLESVLDTPGAKREKRRGRRSGAQSLMSVNAAQLQIPGMGNADKLSMGVKYKEYGEVKN